MDRQPYGELSLTFCGVNFYDGQGFMVAKDAGINSLADLEGAAIAVQAGTTTELNLADYFRKNGWKYELITFEKNDQAAAALESGRADAPAQAGALDLLSAHR